ncbi:MAG TPA: HDOD domain-containing protein [Deltaproteobacteria bacterium]|nr:HDOD domain-containing protein [Deltaproteobacteria bacterium]HPR55381.1 HDOD domain-containing protein [Deltaproteobacteria bacterium]HXK48257.1 HDOD domain-containing protein [Deltaproteobacteria bacterium]
MNIRCPHCRKEYQIPDERLRMLKGDVTIPCPNCKGAIPLSIHDQGKSPGAHSREEAAQVKTPGASAPADGTGLKERILQSLKDLPPMPQVAQKAREVITNPASSFKDLAKVIETDQAIVTRILKIANSPFYGLSGKVSSVQHASVVLGAKTLMEVLTLACSSEILGQTLSGYDLDAGELWKHSLAVASASQTIARRVNPSLEQDAFSAGLIHDAGKLILDPYILERKEAFNAFVEEGSQTFLNAEQHILGFDHAQLASDACEQWHIPSHIALAIRHHHDPSPSGGDQLSYIVHMADAIAMMSGIGAGLDGLLYSLHPEATKILKLKGDDVVEIMGSIADFVDKTTQVV